MTSIVEDINIIEKAMTAGYVPGASPYDCEISEPLRRREVALARRFLSDARELIEREEQKMNNQESNTSNFYSHSDPVERQTAVELTSMQRLRERVAGNTESLQSLYKTLEDLRNRLGGVPPPTAPITAPVAPSMLQMPQSSSVDVGIISRINDSLTQGEVALNGIDEVMRSLRKLV